MTRQADVSVQFYQEKLEANSQSLVFSRLADCYRKKGEIQQAIGVCMQGLQIHPNYVTGRVILGRCYLEQEKLKEATSEFVRVVELDRRNQVAVKMIADVYARQGMKEKAGDLYAYLLRMDPENPSLAKLAQANRGSGETNVLRILGLAPVTEGQERQTSQAPHAAQATFDTIVDVDKTIQMDIVSKQPQGRTNDTAELGEMLVKTQKFDTEELKAMPFVEAVAEAPNLVEETISDIGTAQATDADAAAITGDDISSRMSMIFGEDGAQTQTAEPQTAEQADEAMAVVPDDTEVRTTRDDTVAADSLDSTDRAAAPVVSGSDITSRIEQLFGDEKPSAEPQLAADAVSDFTQAYAPGPSVTADEGDVSVAEEPQPPQTAPHPEERKDISGDDVTQRLNEMFSDSASITEPLAEIGKMLDQHAPAIDEMEPAAAGSEMQDNLPTESIDVSAKTVDEQELLHVETADAISGDDVALRLETIFEEGEKTDAASAPDAPEDTAPRLEKDTPSPVEVSDHAIVIHGDLSDGDIHEMGEATLFGSETLADNTKVRDEEGPAGVEPGEQEMSIDDAVPQDEQPGMSGDDVVGRLDELFSDALLNNGGPESIPDGDKDDDVVNQGFYTMSGENAQTAASEDSLLSELDKNEYEEPRGEATGVTPDDVDKTVLMEQDGGDSTLAVTEEETILSDRGEPLSAQAEVPTPDRGEPSAADDDDVVINGATQISLPTEGDLAHLEADAVPDSGANAQYSIPDHVLTPTLADIYYQQGQPRLALQIYSRLLEADPDNDKLANRIQEIKSALASQETGETAMMDSGKKNEASSRSEPAEEPAREAAGRKKTDIGRKPLSGVRIKKIFKSRIKKSR